MEASRSLKPVGTRPGIIYGLFKIDKYILSTTAYLFDLFCQKLMHLPMN